MRTRETDLAVLASKFVTERRKRQEIGESRARDVRRQLLRFAESVDGVELRKLTHRHVQRYLDAQELAPGSRYHLYASLRTFLPRARRCVSARGAGRSAYAGRSMASGSVMAA